MIHSVPTMRELSEERQAMRRLAGADAFDEVWDGEVVLAPEPDFEHQDLEGALLIWFRAHWVPREAGRYAIQRMNVAAPDREPWTANYRVPDVLLWTSERASRNCRTHWNGSPDVPIEIRSPGDRSYDKLETYLAWGAREVWIIDRDSRAPEIYFAGGDGAVQRRDFDEKGWVRSVFGIAMRSHEGRLEIVLDGDPASRALLP